jgi:hypothetical protein
MIASLGDRIAALNANGNVYNSNLLDQPIWSAWQRIVAAGVSIAVPLGLAAAVGSPDMKTFFQLAGFGAVARTVGKAGDDTMGLIANAQSGTAGQAQQSTFAQLYAPEVTAEQGLAGLPTGMGAFPRRPRLPILGSLPIIGPIFGGKPRMSLARKAFMARRLAATQPQPRRLAQSPFSQGASNAQSLLSSGATSDPTTAGIAGYLQAVGAYSGSTPQLIQAAAALAAQGYYAANASGGCNPNDSIINVGEGIMLCQTNPNPPAPPPAMTPPSSPPAMTPPSGGGMPPPLPPSMTPPSGGSAPIPPPQACPPCSPVVPVNSPMTPPSSPVPSQQPFATPPTQQWFMCPEPCDMPGE